MPQRVAIVGLGQTPFRALTPDMSYKELMFEAATKAYEDAGVNPRTDIDSFVSCTEDFLEGNSISDEFIPDQIGAMLKPVHTTCADGIVGIIDAYMQICTGALDIVAVEAHSKVSNMLTPDYCTAFAMDPILNRPLAHNPYFIAGMEMTRYLHESGTTREQCALVSVRNKRAALENPLAAYGASITLEQVMNSETMFSPLTRLEMSPSVDGAIIVVLASEEKARKLKGIPVWVKGVGWCSDTPSLENKEWGKAIYAQLAAEMTYKLAGIKIPPEEIDLVEVDDSFSYKELQHLEAVGLCQKGEAGLLVQEGVTGRDGRLPVNLSGGSLGAGHLGEATGLAKVGEVVLQLRGEAGRKQVPDARIGLAQCWQGIPSASGAVIILSN